MSVVITVNIGGCKQVAWQLTVGTQWVHISCLYCFQILVTRLLFRSEMDNQFISSEQNNAESCLSESWNVVANNDVNNGSEGSDGESIEVIEEESQLDSYPRTLWESAIAEDAKIPFYPPSQERSLVCEPCQNETNVTRENIITNGFNFFASCCLFYVCLFSVLLSSASVPLIFFEFGDLTTLGPLKYIFSYPFENSANDYQELLNQIKTYKEESQDLRVIVADLNTAVTSLKRELDSKNEKPIPDNFADENLNNENKLFGQLLNIQTGNLPTDNDSKGDVETKTYENSFKVIQDMLKHLTVGDENLEILKKVKLFYLIPEHLSVLSEHYSTNVNIRKFIDFWKNKLSEDNEKLISDIKEMRLKVIRHTVKRLNHVEKLFLENLCNLQNIKKAECNAVFTKHYVNLDVPVTYEKPFDDEQFNKDEYVIKSESDLKTIESKSNEKMSYDLKKNDSETNVSKLYDLKKNDSVKNEKKSYDLKANENSVKEGVEEENIDLRSETNIEHLFPLNEGDKADNKDKSKTLSDQEINMNQQKQKVVTHAPSRPMKTNSASQVKGMNSDIGRDECDEEDPSTNSFSSFSRASCERSSAKDQWVLQWREGRTAEGWWFLRLGHHRARLRRAQGRRPYYLRKKGLMFRKPFFINHRIYAKVYANDKDFLTSQGFL